MPKKVDIRRKGELEDILYNMAADYILFFPDGEWKAMTGRPPFINGHGIFLMKTQRINTRSYARALITRLCRRMLPAFFREQNLHDLEVG